ncbi:MULTISPECIES: methyl-accepting chemotaxis protein [Acidobacteriaceae]|uniref:methyl-accepting chemotaxis protein n=1 Tax=Acidobacteriaceae TaxID=204434 RepID=UPI00131A93F7|nr:MULTISPECIES: methyl-accepting chemotaxis protein [Acidobacteriaceae]MDW5265228.1 methyl-accepting chemotaxis protein [Edaphobacter sp.]
MKLESKLGLSTGFLIIAMFLSAYTAHVRIEEANHLSDVVTTSRLPIIMGSRDVDSHLTRTISSLESYMLFGLDPATSASFREARKQQFEMAEAAVAKLSQDSTHFDLGADSSRLAMLESGLARLKPLEEKVEALNETKTSQGTAQAYDTLQNQILPLERSLFTTVTDLAQSQMSQTNEELVQLRRANRSTLLTLWLATIFGAIVGGLISTFLARRITKGVDLVAERANAIAAGDLTGDALDLKSQDQIGSLATAMQQMQTSLSSIIGTVVHTSGSLTGSAASMRTASDQIHRRIDQQSQQTQQAATAMQEMSASIAEVSRHTQSAAETARNAAETARDGGTIVKEVLGNMHSIATAVRDTSSTVTLLGDDSRRISQIVTVIDEIARKTNLLALNAAIEAARAGDQGRGFAVVAGEVRRLAESTAQATGEIASMIQGIQDRTRTAIASMESGTETVQQGVVTTTQAGEALEKIIGMAERVDRMIAQIAIAASQQAAAADQSSASLDSIHSLSHENLTEMATTAAGIESLRSTAVALEQQVDRFRLQSPADSRLMRSPKTSEMHPAATFQPA